MDSPYTTTITNAAHARGIGITVLDPVLPIFELQHKDRSVRCYNGLTDLTGSASFHLTQDKGAANRFLRANGFSVPAQELFDSYPKALSFLDRYEQIVVKPIAQWGGRGVSTHIAGPRELRRALAFARRYSDEIILEECVGGVDWRLIYVDFRFVTAIQRNAALVTGNGLDDLEALIKSRNKQTRKVDASNVIPLDKETARCLEAQNLGYSYVPPPGADIRVRRTTNYHTGGTVDIVPDKIPSHIRDIGESIACLTKIPVLGVDILYNTDGQYRVIELSPDLAISPPEGDIVAEAFLDMLFPDSVSSHASKNSNGNVEDKSALHASQRVAERISA
jgi:D-alanine-D-alanine ligase-like ATP-grasp enzyme